MEIYKIIDAIRANRIRITDHAYEEARADKLSFDEIYLSVFDGEIIEKYPDDEPYPSCLLYGLNSKKEPIHSVWAYNSENRWAVLITYRVLSVVSKTFRIKHVELNRVTGNV